MPSGLVSAERDAPLDVPNPHDTLRGPVTRSGRSRFQRREATPTNPSTT